MVDDEGTTGPESYAAAWYPDPDGRHDQRYFDGAVWTERVRTAGVERTDLLDGSYLAPSAASTMAAFYPTASVPPDPGRAVARNAAGAGLVIAAIGWVAMAASTQLAWNGSVSLFALEPETGSPTSADAVSQLQTQVAISLGMVVLVILGTTLRYQPGKVYGFLYGGCLGLVVCWRKLDRDATSIRSNLLGAFVVIVHGIVAWALLHAVTETFEHVRLGTGVLAYGAGLVLVLLGVLMGRRRIVGRA
ncbi:MAG: DUF2510 domain-containing protein [Aquihabitans sp.]